MSIQLEHVEKVHETFSPVLFLFVYQPSDPSSAFQTTWTVLFGIVYKATVAYSLAMAAEGPTSIRETWIVTNSSSAARYHSLLVLTVNINPNRGQTSNGTFKFGMIALLYSFVCRLSTKYDC